MSIIDSTFGKDGAFSKQFAGYEPRPGQIKLATAILHALENKTHLLGEGPCGTGKSQAYIVPATYMAATHKKKVVIATANIALQEQLVTKDLPEAQKILPWSFTFGLVKGLNNYLCDLRFSQSMSKASVQTAMFSNMDEIKQFAEISEWAENTENGDISELPFIPSPKLWSMLSTTADDCLKADCPMVDSCRAIQSRKAAYGCDIIITNYHMLFADLAVRANGGKGVLPDYNILIMDEAHEAPDIARDFFGFQVAQRGIEQIATITKNLLKDEALSKSLRTASDTFFDDLITFARSKEYRIRIKKTNCVTADKLLNDLDRVSKAAALLKEVETDVEAKAQAKNLAERSANARTNIQEAIELTDKEKVYWIDGFKEKSGGFVKLCGKSIFSSDRMEKSVYGSGFDSVIAVSATMTTGNPNTRGAFEFIRKELGAPEDIATCVVDSPFDFTKQGLVIVPEGMPSPKDTNFSAAVASATLKTIQAAKGRTLGLYTSYKNLNAAYDAVQYCGYRVFKQGDMPRVELTKQFRMDTSSVLLGTDSFWTGVDVPGEALTCLVIDRLPFTSPEDPVVDAISELDSSAFMNYHVPKAVITFRQGVGRLIRTQTDIGVVVVLDTRIVDSRWGKGFFWTALPKGIQARRDIGSIQPFLDWAKQQVGA